jgi:hypothetical protein
MNLYQIDEQIASLIDAETGEIKDFAAFVNLQMQREQKIENIALWVKNLLSEASAIKAEIDTLAKRKKAADLKVEKLKKYLGIILCGESFKTPRCVITFRPSKSLRIDNSSEFIKWAKQHGKDDFISYSAPTVNKKAITDAIKDGEEIPGVELTEHNNLQLK